jgi:hypothetical protein
MQNLVRYFNLCIIWASNNFASKIHELHSNHFQNLASFSPDDVCHKERPPNLDPVRVELENVFQFEFCAKCVHGCRLVTKL